ncbi:MAG: hypothetical protein AAFO04_02115 [Cyanobacteria bacterium J06592_8]
MRRIQKINGNQNSVKFRTRFFQLAFLFSIPISSVNGFIFPHLSIARTIIRPNSINQQTCPIELQSLVDEMLPDLPSYANRVIQRQDRNRRDTYVLLAKQLDELEPLPFNVNLENPDDTNLIYLTTLERQHDRNQILRFQQFHWVFLRKTASGWELENIFSKSNSYPRYGLYSLPGDSSKSAIAQAIRLWLRDCHAG